MRFGNSHLHKEKREECKDCRLNKSDENLEEHNGNGENHWHEMLNNQNHYFPREDIPEKTK